MDAALLDRCTHTVDRIHRLLLSIPEPEQRERADGWSVPEVVGHLVDSAGNNHQRVCRYVPGGELTFPAYDQREFVSRAGYNSFEWPVLVTLWHSYNLLLLHMFARIPDDRLLSSTVAIGGSEPISLNRLIGDYYTHMEIHEAQIRRIVGV